jgi:hypothetical protein
MVTPKDAGTAWQAGIELLKGLANLPAPEKVYYELQRFNNNMERIQPDLAKLAKSLEGVNPGDIRNLALALQGMKVSEMLLVMNDTNSTISKLYEKLWGKK